MQLANFESDIASDMKKIVLLRYMDISPLARNIENLFLHKSIKGPETVQTLEAVQKQHVISTEAGYGQRFRACARVLTGVYSVVVLLAARDSSSQLPRLIHECNRPTTPFPSLGMQHGFALMQQAQRPIPVQQVAASLKQKAQLVQESILHELNRPPSPEEEEEEESGSKEEEAEEEEAVTKTESDGKSGTPKTTVGYDSVKRRLHPLSNKKAHRIFEHCKGFLQNCAPLQKFATPPEDHLLTRHEDFKKLLNELDNVIETNKMLCKVLSTPYANIWVLDNDLGGHMVGPW